MKPTDFSVTISASRCVLDNLHYTLRVGAGFFVAGVCVNGEGDTYFSTLAEATNAAKDALEMLSA